MSNKYFFYPKSPQLIAWQEILRAMSPLSQEIPTDDLVMMTGEFKANTLHDSPPSTSDERAEVVEVTTDHLAVSAEQAPPGDGTCDPDVKVAIVRDENICETVTIDTTTDTTVLATDDSDVQKESIKVTLLADSDEEEGANFSDEALSVFSSDEDSTTPASVGVSPPPTPGLVLHPASTTQSQGNTSKIQGTGRQYSNVKKRKFWSKPKKKALVKKATPLPPLNSKQFVRKCCQPTSSDAEAIVGDDIKSSPSKPQAVRSHTVKPPRPPQPPLARRQSDLAIQETELQPFLHHDSHVSYMTDYLTHDSYTIRVTRAANRRAAYRASRQISMPSTAKSPFLVSPTADIEQNCSIEMTRKAREMEARYPDTLGRNSKPRRLGVNRTQSLGTLANTFTDDIGSNLQLGIGRVLLASTRTSGNQNVHQSPQTSLPIVLATGAASHTAADPALTKNLHSSVLGVRVKEELGNALHIQSLQRRLVADRPIATTHVPQHSVSLDHGLLLLRSASEKSAEQQDSSIRGLSLEDSSRSRVRRGVSLDIHQPKTGVCVFCVCARHCGVHLRVGECAFVCVCVCVEDGRLYSEMILQAVILLVLAVGFVKKNYKCFALKSACTPLTCLVLS